MREEESVSAVEPEIHGELRSQLGRVLATLPEAEVGEQMADRLLEAIPEFAELIDPDFRAGLVLSCTANLQTIWNRMLDPDDLAPGGVTPPAGATAWARELVHRGVPLAALLRAYRLGHAFAQDRTQQAVEELEISAESRWRVLAVFSRWTFEYVDAICTQLVEDYERERAQWVRGAAAARAELVQAIIDRRAVDARGASERLRYDVTRTHVAMIVWADGADPSRVPGWLETAAIDLAQELGGGPVLTIPVGERVVWSWTTGGALLDDPAALPVRVPDGLRATVGSRGDGPEGMADSHDDARAARRASEMLGLRTGSVLGYRSAALTALLTAEPTPAVRFVKTELGALACDDDASRRLRATLRTYLEECLSAVRAGRRLSIHSNTVIYRVKQAEEILGHSVEQRRLELEVALRLAERLDALRSAAERESLRASIER
jgi:DNA-binding PucR family transcriptional regulator